MGIIRRLFQGFKIFLFHFFRWLLRYIDYINPRLYMSLYTKLLSSYGLNMSGFPRYISTKVKFDDFSRIFLGERVVISENVVLLTHDYSLTTGLISISEEPSSDTAFLGNIKIGSNVFIGMGSILLPGVEIGDNVIIGAGSIVRGIIPTNSIVKGNPAIVVSELKEKANYWKSKLENTELRNDN